MIEEIKVEQRTEEWFMQRINLITSSDFKKVMSKGETRKSFLFKKASEIILNKNEEILPSIDMQRGIDDEDFVIQLYEQTKEIKVNRVGIIKSGRFGCSPDGLVENDGIIEIKSRKPYLQIRTLIEKKIPCEYFSQIQGQLMVTERDWCDIVIYSEGLPLFIKRSYYDDEFISCLKKTLNEFVEELDEVVREIMAYKN